jgi:DNA-binding transcriptional MerR regulator/methylmalonyl-CoA mutase cobalamin-binding subunit
MAKKSSSLYPIRAAARLTKLSIDTLRAWERRYRAVEPSRRKGLRFYSEADIYRLRLLRAAVEHGYSIGQAARLSDEELSSLGERSISARTRTPGEIPIETILTAIDDFQYLQADRELARLAALLPPQDLISNVALPLMRIAGERWHEQRMRIAQEHLMSQLLSSLLSSIMRTYSTPNPAALVLTATLSDDLHDFGILAAAILAAGAGFGVVHLGPSLPAREIVYAVKRSNADVVLLSVTNAQDRMLREEQLRSIRSGIPRKTTLWVGVNPSDTVLNVNGILILRSFAEFERELHRIGK